MSVYIIAEAGVNHNGDINLAKRLVDCAKEAGCDCVKFQTFQTENLVTKNAKKADYQSQNMKNTESQYQMLKKLELSFDDFKELKLHCDKCGIDFLSTPFDEESADWLTKLGVTQYKISSGEITNKPLLQYVAKKKKRILLSTGMSTMDEVKEAIQWIVDAGNTDIVVFHCTSNYPAPYESVNMNAMITLKKELDLPVGYSDHTQGNEISLMAVSLGATMIEKHFTVSRKLEGPDHKASLEPEELKALVKAIRNVELAFGDGKKMPTIFEENVKTVARKSLVFKRDIKKGEVVTIQDIVCKRPGIGIAPKHLECFVGRRINQDCSKDDFLKQKQFEEA